MTNTNIIYYDEATVSKTRSSFKVELEESAVTIFIPFSVVQNICEKTADDEAMIAILLAYIEDTRKSAITPTIRIRKIKDETIVVNITELLVKYPVEQLIEIVRGLKWHQIREIFESVNPEEQIEEFV